MGDGALLVKTLCYVQCSVLLVFLVIMFTSDFALDHTLMPVTICSTKLLCVIHILIDVNRNLLDCTTYYKEDGMILRKRG